MAFELVSIYTHKHMHIKMFFFMRFVKSNKERSFRTVWESGVGMQERSASPNKAQG